MLLLVLVVVAMLVAAVVGASVMLVVVMVRGMVEVAGVAAVVAGDPCRDLVLRLLRRGSLVVAGTVSRVCAVLCRIRCDGLRHCVGPCLGLAVVRSRVG